MTEGLELAQEFHSNLPDRIREYLSRERGIAQGIIDCRLLGWNGNRITIPILDREGRFAFFKLAKGPNDQSGSPKMLATPGARAELYDWQTVLAAPEAIIICEGEFDRLVLESRGFAAVTSTGGALTFRSEWAGAFRDIPRVFVCYDNDQAGRIGAERVARLVPHARIVRLPDEVGDGGDVTDFFVRLGRNGDDFLKLLEAAEPLPQDESAADSVENRFPSGPDNDGEVVRLKSSVAIEDVISRYVTLLVRGESYTARCPFHEDRNPSFVVYQKTQTFYCFGCRAHGDVITFLMRAEGLTFREALDTLRQFNNHHGGQTHRVN